MQIKSLRALWHKMQVVDDTASPEAVERLRKLGHYYQLREEGCSAALAFKVLGWSSATHYRWLKRYREHGMAGLEARSRRPRRTRKRRWTRRESQMVQDLRLAHPAWGRRKIWKVLTRDSGLKLSLSTVGRVLGSLLARRVVLPAAFYISGRVKAVRRRLFNGHAQRWRYGEKAEGPGCKVQVDTMTVNFPGFTVKEFKAVCPVTGFAVMRAYSRATARNAKRFLEVLRQETPFEIASIQVDGGSEFMREFEDACADLAIPLHVLPPRSPKYNGCVERANGTSRAEFYNRYEGELTIAAVNEDLAKFQQHYNHYRPHDGLDLDTPMEYYTRLAQAA